MQSTKMTPTERQATFSLATIMSLRMLGLFMVLPLFSLYAQPMQGATPAFIGLAMGIYGLTQGLLQIPFGMLSDHWGRKPLILSGLLLFAIGSIVCASTHSIVILMLGRALQGAGAIGSTIMAFIADFTHEKQRTKAMAICGITIGFSFSGAMILGPLLANWFTINGLFWLTAIFGLSAAAMLFLWTPPAPKATWHAETEPAFNQFFAVLKNSTLMRLNSGIFLLHAILTASYIIIPLHLEKMAGLPGNQQWTVYLPVLALAFIGCIPLILRAEKKQHLKKYFLSAIGTLIVAELGLWFFAKSLLISASSLLLFFTAFSVLEAFLPSLVSKSAPPHRKGTALGIYSSLQFLGIFAGGALGGWIYGKFGSMQVYLFCIGLAVLWLTIAVKMEIPQTSKF